MEPVRPALDKTMPIDAYSLLSQFPNLCFNLKKGDDWFVFVFFSGILHLVAGGI